MGGSVGREIVAGAIADLQKLTAQEAGRTEGEQWEEPAESCVDVHDAVYEWWNSGRYARAETCFLHSLCAGPAVTAHVVCDHCSQVEDAKQVDTRLCSFLATLRYHNPASASSGGLNSVIVVTHSLIIKEFCKKYPLRNIVTSMRGLKQWE